VVASAIEITLTNAELQGRKVSGNISIAVGEAGRGPRS
jgi:hypothetical protein